MQLFGVVFDRAVEGDQIPARSLASFS
jgi:hypothetical protein